MTIPDLVLALLTEACFKKSLLTTGLLNRAGDLVYVLLKHKRTSLEAPKCASEALHLVYAAKIEHLVDIKSEWHFSALRALPQDIDGFQMQELAADIDQKAPMLSALLNVLLSAWKRLNQCPNALESQAHPVMVTADADEDELLLEGQSRMPSSPEELCFEKQKQKECILAIVRLTLL